MGFVQYSLEVPRPWQEYRSVLSLTARGSGELRAKASQGRALPGVLKGLTTCGHRGWLIGFHPRQPTRRFNSGITEQTSIYFDESFSEENKNGNKHPSARTPPVHNIFVACAIVDGDNPGAMIKCTQIVLAERFHGHPEYSVDFTMYAARRADENIFRK